MIKPESNAEQQLLTERKQIYEMIDAAWELAAQKGKHPLENGCSCISCVNKRKSIIRPFVKKWKYWL